MTERLGGEGAGEAIIAVGRVTGLLGAYLSLVTLLLMARVPWLERGVGLVRLSTWHRYAGSTSLTLILVHVAATAVGYAIVEDGGALRRARADDHRHAGDDHARRSPPGC